MQDDSEISQGARILKSVYYSAGAVLSAQIGSRPSRIWRAILDRMDVLKQGLIRRTGTGETPEIWNMNWLGSLGPVRLSTAPAPKLVDELTDSMTASWSR